ncbi:MAG: DUF3095 domain-containing protein [Balneolaceae bacterium]|nr:DUF3095 domain-containing protein [Balneolaceae bacterium]
MQRQSNRFYSDLPLIHDFSEASDGSNYRDLPENWYVVATDIVNSTAAVRDDNYKSVNILGASPIAAILNLTDRNSIPFTFGGDGALVCIPPELVEECLKILSSCRNIGFEAYGLDLRAAIIPVTYLNKIGKPIQVARFVASEHYDQALFMGEGVAYSDFILKSQKDDHEQFHITEASHSPEVNFGGLECRWKEVSHNDKEVITLLIHANPRTEDPGEIYREVMQKMKELFGFDYGTNPINPNALSMNLLPTKLMGETKLRTFGMGLWDRMKYLLKTQIEILTGKIFMKLGYKSSKTDWSLYKSDLSLNSDYRKFDDMLRVVITGKQEQRKKLESYLDGMFASSKLAYGIHVTDAAMVTCMVFEYHRSHIHFVDGSNGGYVMASRQLKKQMEMLQEEDVLQY